MMKNWRLLLLIPAWLALTAASFNPSLYGGRYSTGGTAAASAVIVGATASTTNGGSTTTHGPIALLGCQVYNGNASARSFMFYDSQTVPADGTRAFKAFIANCPAATTCSWSPPMGTEGSAGVIFATGVSWENSSTFPTTTVGSADSTVACSYMH